MKKNSVIILICMALFAVNVCNSKNNNGNNQTVDWDWAILLPLTSAAMLG